MYKRIFFYQMYFNIFKYTINVRAAKTISFDYDLTEEQKLLWLYSRLGRISLIKPRIHVKHSYMFNIHAYSRVCTTDLLYKFFWYKEINKTVYSIILTIVKLIHAYTGISLQVTLGTGDSGDTFYTVSRYANLKRK